MPDGNDFRLVNDLARHTAWAHAPAVAYATYGVGLFALLAPLMAFTRVYVGAHYPSDVMLGLAEGTMVAILGGYLARPMLSRAWSRIWRTRLAVLVARPDEPIAQLRQ